MDITDKRIDSGKAFDWGKTSAEYAKYRDIYPDVFYQKVADRGLCIEGQKVLDLGTGSGVLPRNMYRFGAKWDAEHRALLADVPDSFEVLHYAAIAVLKKKVIL